VAVYRLQCLFGICFSDWTLYGGIEQLMIQAEAEPAVSSQQIRGLAASMQC